MAQDEVLDEAYSGAHRSIGARQRRPQRSCDICRQRKIRCDGPNMPDSCCSNCIAFGSPCTYFEPAKKRGPKNINNRMLEELKKENASLKAKLRALSLCSLCAQPLQSQPQGQGTSRSTSVFHHSTPESDTTSSDPKEPPDEEDFTGDELVTRFRQFNIKSLKPKYFGSASSFALANSAISMKEQYLGRPLSMQSRRPMYWDSLPWEKVVYDARPNYVYPPSDLTSSLLGIYFANVHPTIPILHRPSFERSVAEGLHLTNMEFGGTLLSVLALASRYSKDPRVFVDDDPSLLLSAGWKFASQMRNLRFSLSSTTIYEVQMYLILTIYGLGTSAPQTSWLYVGLGIRFLQQRGEHRRKREGYKFDAEDELWKRAFWSFLCLERLVCLFLGRPMSLYSEEYDVKLPFEVDDEYWDSGFAQPPGKPSQLSYFVCHIRLCEILGDVLRRIYGSKKSKILMGWDGPDWDQRVVSELDSAMNDFVDTVPLHLRWDPENPPQGIFFDQSALLHIIYNHLLIAIHRPYIQSIITTGAPSLSICARAARAILHTANMWLSKLQRMPLPHIINPVFVSGLILILYTMGTKRAGLSMEKNKDLVHVMTALEILKFAESRFQPAGRLWEMLRELLSIDGSLPPNAQGDSVDAGASKAAASEPQSIPFKAEDNPVPSLSEFPDGYSQPEPTFDSWNDQSAGLRPGMSIEQLLAEADPLDSMDAIIDDELMSMWMAAPTNMGNIGNWTSYMENMNGSAADVSWPAAQQ